MSSPRVTSTFCLISFALLLGAVSGANNIDPLFSYCSNENFTANGGPYQTNLNILMGYLYYQAPPTGFGLGSLGENASQANGLAQCRADVSAMDCRTCVADAITNIRKNCPNSKSAKLFYDKCMLKYSNDELFFGRIDNETKYFILNVNNVSNPVTFNQKSKELLSELANEASAGNPIMSASGEIMVPLDSIRIYGLAECTRDLSSSDCKMCLDSIIGDLPSCCDGKQGGRVITGSCMIHYEIYPFVKA